MRETHCAACYRNSTDLEEDSASEQNRATSSAAAAML